MRDWLIGRTPLNAAGERCSVCGGPDHRLDELPPAYAYLLGLYLGDGCLAAHRRGVYKLRVFLDLRYPAIVDECEAAIRLLAPRNRVNRLLRTSNYVNSDAYTHVEVSGYSKSWPCLFPQHEKGRKHERPIKLAEWQEELVSRHSKLLLRGLIHSDGCRFINTGKGWRCPRYAFSNLSADIRDIFCQACDRLELHWTTAPRTVYVSRKADVVRMDEFIGPKS